jgi:hypothetical protein
MRIIISLIAIIITLGCDNADHHRVKSAHPQHPITLNISINNASTNTLDWVELEWGGPAVPGGIIPPGTSKTTLSAEWPSVPGAIITLVDNKTRKPYKIEISLSAANGQISAGGIQHVTFRILSYDKAVVVCE